MEQVIFGGAGYGFPAPTTGTRYNTLQSGYSWGANEFQRQQVISTDGVIKKLRGRLSAAPGAGKKYTFTLMLNGNPTALTYDIADAATFGSNMVDEVVVTGGDYVSIRCVPDNTPTSVYAYWTSVFEGDNPNESLIMGVAPSTLDRNNTVFGQVMTSGTSLSYAVGAENDRRQLIPTSGKIKNFYVNLTIDPGTPPDAYRLTVRLNGATVAQSPIVTITANDKTGSDLVHELAVVAGDYITLMVEPLNTPSQWPNAAWGLTFEADIDGESIVIGGSYNNLPNTWTRYGYLSSTEGAGWDVNENRKYQIGQVCTVRKLHILTGVPPGAGKKWDFAIRIAGASNVVATVADAATTGDSGALEDTVGLSDYVGLEADPDNTPPNSDCFWGLVGYIMPSGSEDLLCAFEVGQGSEDLLGKFEVGQDSAELLGRAAIRHPGSAELLGNGIIRHSDTAELLGKGEIQQSGSTELLGNGIIRHPGSAELHGKFEAQATAELLAKAEIQQSGSTELLGNGIIRHPGSAELLGRAEVQQSGSAELIGRAEIRQSDSAEFLGKADVQQSDSAELLGNAIIRHLGSAELLGKTDVQQSGSAELLGRAEVQQSGSAELLGKFEAQVTAELLGKIEVQQSGSAELLGKAEVQQSGSAEILGNVEIRQSGSAELLGRAEVTQPDSAELLSRAVIRHVGTPVELLGRAIIRQSGFTELLGKAIVKNASSAELLGRAVIRHVGTPVELLGKAKVQQSGSAELLSKADIRQSGSAELLGRAEVRQPDSAELLGEFIVRHEASADLLGEFIARHEASRDLLGEFISKNVGSADFLGELVVRHPSSQDLLGELIARHLASLDLLGEFIVRQVTSEDLLGELVVRHEASVDLHAAFESQATVDLFGKFIVRQPATINLPGEFIVKHSAELDLPAKLQVTHSERLLSKLWIRHPYRLWTNRRYVNGVVELDENELSDALLEYVIQGVMDDIKSLLINEALLAYVLWTDITVTPKLIRRAATYGTVASLYSRDINDPNRRIVLGLRTIRIRAAQIRSAQERAMDYWESRMEKMMDLYLTSGNRRLIIVDTEDEEPVFSLEDIPFYSEDPYKIEVRPS